MPNTSNPPILFSLIIFTAGALTAALSTTLYNSLLPTEASTIPPPASPPSTSPSSKSTPSASSSHSSHSSSQLSDYPYPNSNFIPNPRTLQTPYGTFRIYEWGPANSHRKVLLLHGISGSCIVLLALADLLAKAGCRVILPDLPGRGWSGGPDQDLRYDSRFYASFISMCLMSSSVSWTGTAPHNPNGIEAGASSSTTDASKESKGTFTLLGYSLGGGLAADFASYFPGLIEDLILIAPGGLLKSDWKSRAIYSGLWPEWYMRRLLRRRLGLEDASVYTLPSSSSSTTSASSVNNTLKDMLEPDLTNQEAAAAPVVPVVPAEVGMSLETKASVTDKEREGEGEGGSESESEREELPTAASIQSANENINAIVSWQLEKNPSFVHAFTSSIRFAPTRDQHDRWRVLGGFVSGAKKARAVEHDAKSVEHDTKSAEHAPDQSKDRRRSDTDAELTHSFTSNAVLTILGGKDPIIKPEEFIPDALDVLGGREHLDTVVYGDAGHEVACSHAGEIGGVLLRRWGLRS